MTSGQADCRRKTDSAATSTSDAYLFERSADRTILSCIGAQCTKDAVNASGDTDLSREKKWGNSLKCSPSRELLVTPCLSGQTPVSTPVHEGPLFVSRQAWAVKLYAPVAARLSSAGVSAA